MKKHLLFSFLYLFSFLVQADGVSIVNSKQMTCDQLYSECQVCTDNTYLFPLNSFSSNPDSLEVEADATEITENEDYLITGNVRLLSNENFLSAEQVVISKKNKTSTASGSVNYQDLNFLLSGDELVVEKIDNDELKVGVTVAKYQEIKTKANGTAETVNKNSDIATLDQSTYSFCPINNSDWFIKADQIKLNLINNRAIAKNASLVFFGMPIFYLPRYSWVSSGRGSGFLSPGLNIYKEANATSSDFLTRIPYYFNIAPDRDLLVALSYLSSRGAIFEGKYRQLISNKTQDDGLFALEAQHLFNDKITKSNRWLLDTTIELEINNNTHFSMHYSKVSDSNYFREIARTRTSEERLNSHYKIEYNNPPLPELKDSGKLDIQRIAKVNYGRNTIAGNPSLNQTSFMATSENEQVINHGLPKYTKSFETALFARKINAVSAQSTLDLGLISTNFSHKTIGKTTGTRTHGEIKLFKAFGALKPFTSSQLSSDASIGFTNYSLDNINNESRVFGSFDLDLSFPFFKSTTLFGNSVTRTLRPTISYDYSSKTKQSNIPVFDTTDTLTKILTYQALSSGDRYDGVDRIINENDITLSFKSSYTDNKKPYSSDRLNFLIAQRYYGDEEAVSITSNTNFEKRRKYSDIAASLDFSLDDYDRLKTQVVIQYDPQAAEVKKHEVSITFKPHERRFLSVKQTDDATSKSLNISGAYPITNQFHIFAGIDKSLTTGVINKETTGIAYEDCCWSARLGHFKEAFVEGTATYDYSTGFELVFKGLGSTDTNLRNHIQENLPDYKVVLSEQVNYNKLTPK